MFIPINRASDDDEGSPQDLDIRDLLLKGNINRNNRNEARNLFQKKYKAHTFKISCQIVKGVVDKLAVVESGSSENKLR